MTSIKDVARHAGVSNGTISRYFHEPNRVRKDTRERIHAAIEALGYRPNTLARNFRLGKTRLILTLMEAVGDPFYGDVMAGITYVARQRGYKIHIAEYERGSLSRSDLRDIVQSRQADGIIVLGGRAAFRQDQEGEIVTGTPPIIVCGETADPALISYPRVQIDGFEASKELTDYLIGLGHKTIAYMGGEAGSILLLDREGGYRAAMAEADLLINDDLVVYGELDVARARQATRELINAGTLPTAIVCANDEMAIGTIAELYAMKIKVPDDISVVGFDNTRYAETSIPPLTTIAQPSHSIGETTMYRLLQSIKNPELDTGTIFLPHRLIIRQSARSPSKTVPPTADAKIF